MNYHYKTSKTCSTAIDFDLTDGAVTDIRFTGGCNGNLKAIGKILDGWKAEDIIAKCEGNTCGRSSTSCADQLSKALRKALDEQAK